MNGTSAPLQTAAAPRAEILEPYNLASLEDDPRLRRLTDFAADLCEVPTALVSLVEDERQWFAARTGLEARETPRAVSFCTHAIQSDALMVVPDATLDARFRENPLVTGEPFIRFYAGAPLVNAAGERLGTLCVIDQQPRAGLTDLQARGLETLAGAAMTLFEAHRALLERDLETSAARTERDDRALRFVTLADAMPQMVWSTLPDGFHDYYNARWYEFTGVPEGSTDGEGWNGMFHPDDRERAWGAWRHSLATGEPYEIEYRLRDRAGDYRWVLGRALPMRDEQGRIVRWFGTCTDIHDQKQASEQRELIAHELSHRVKNIFSVISGLIALSAKMRPELKPAADELRERVVALGKAHDFVRPHSERSRPPRAQTSLHGLLEELLAPYQSAGERRIELTGPDLTIDDQSATPLALLFHELATNAAKYGALTSEGGRVRIESSVDGGKALLRWQEFGGPRVSPGSEGFGSRLIAMSV